MTKKFSQYYNFLFIFSVWLIAFYVFTSEGYSSFSVWRTDWIRWDSSWYEKIWNDGYSFIDSRTLVFPPGYSVFIGLIAKISNFNFHFIAFILNPILFFIGSYLATRVLEFKLNISRYKIFILILSNPVAYFSFATYSDMTFYCLFWMLLYLEVMPHLEFKKTIVPKILIYILAPWFRLTGVVICTWIFLKKRMSLLTVVSVFLWLFFNAYITGDPFYFIKAQQLFGMPSGNFIDGFRYSLSGLLEIPSNVNSEVLGAYLQINFLPIVYIFGNLATALWLLFRKEHLFSLSIFTILFISHNQAFWRSAVRYDLPLFPFLFAAILCLLNKFLQNKFSSLSRDVFLAIALINFTLQIYLARLFHSGHWGF